jgi:hypothetical protein
LNEWRSLSTNPIANTHCCECHFAYLTLVGNVIEKPICEKLGHYMYTNLFIFFLLNNLIIFTFSSFLSIIDKKHRLRDILSYNDTIGYYCWSLIFYSSIIILAFIIRFIFIKNKKLYINYYVQKITFIKFTIALFVFTLSIFLEILLTCLVVTIFIQIFLKLHFDSIKRINTANDQTILNYNQSESLPV